MAAVPNGDSTIRVKDEDLVLFKTARNLRNAILGGLVGYLSFVMLWLYTVLVLPEILNIPYSILAFVIVGTLSMGLIGWERTRIVKRIATHGFVFTYWAQRLLSWSFWIGNALAIYPIIWFYARIPNFPVALSLGLLGAYFLLIFVWATFPPLIPTLRESRMCMLQFLSDWNLGIPEIRPGHKWLLRSLRGTEQNLRSWGLSTSPGTLFLGASYSIFKGQLSAVELESLAEWLITPSEWYKVNSTIPFLLSQAEIAGESGFGKFKGLWELMLDLPWQKISYVILALGGIPSFILAVEKIFRP